MNAKSRLQANVVLIRVAVWGQAIGFLVMASFLAIEDAPEFFKRVSPWNIIVPIIAVVVIQMKMPSNFLVRNVSTGMLSIFILIVSLSTTAIALSYLVHAFSIPEFLITSGWQYSQTTSIFVFVVFSAALIANIVFLICALREGNKSKTNA